ncbi:helix-turn-helix domain-containing protein [Bradyrhizobium sp. SZCCHNS30571]|uniref:helix-turn-helix domain-containing protein n=1 Tax=unclassified Bradyrhizobium TaxID=2631580 RepID=UPI003967130B
MAKIAGVRQATISRWEAGLTDPSLKHLKRIRAEARKRRLAWNDCLLLGDRSRAA